jgi:hypothetical protein
MNVSATNSTYTNYVNQTSSTSKTEKNNGSFMSTLQKVSNKEDSNTQVNDLLDIQEFKNMSKEKQNKLGNKLIEKYGEEKGTAYLFSLREASQFSDKKMQNSVFDNLSKMSTEDIFMFTGDVGLSTIGYLSGNELKASYSINLDKNNQVEYGNSDINVGAYFNSLGSEEFQYLFSTLKSSHDSMAKVVGNEQASKYSKIYEGILSSYKDYVNNSKNEAFYG